MNNKTQSVAITTMSVVVIVVSAKNLIQTHRREKARLASIKLDRTASIRARDAVISRVERGDFMTYTDANRAFHDQLEFEKIAVRFDK